MVNSGNLRPLSPRHHKFTLQPSSRPQHLADYHNNSSTHPHFSISLYIKIIPHQKLSSSEFILQVDRCKFFNNRNTTSRPNPWPKLTTSALVVISNVSLKSLELHGRAQHSLELFFITIAPVINFSLL